jgi:hypothetical protein
MGTHIALNDDGTWTLDQIAVDKITISQETLRQMVNAHNDLVANHQTTKRYRTLRNVLESSVAKSAHNDRVNLAAAFTLAQVLRTGVVVEHTFNDGSTIRIGMVD